MSEQLELLPTVNKGSLPPGVIQIIQHQALERLAARDPILRHVLEVKVCERERYVWREPAHFCTSLKGGLQSKKKLR